MTPTGVGPGDWAYLASCWDVEPGLVHTDHTDTDWRDDETLHGFCSWR